MTTGWVFIRRAIASEVTGPPPRRTYSSIHSSFYVAMVSLLLRSTKRSSEIRPSRLAGFRATWP